MNSLKKNEDFSFVYKAGKSYANDYLIMYTMKNGMESNRYGISVSRKVGNSCIRHRVKRQIKEVIRLNEIVFNNGYDIIFIARNKTAFANFEIIKRKIISLAQKII